MMTQVTNRANLNINKRSQYSTVFLLLPVMHINKTTGNKNESYVLKLRPKSLGQFFHRLSRGKK
jgi:hypothetical protein